MVDIFDPTLKSSNAYKTKQGYKVKKPLKIIGNVVICIIIVLFIFIVRQSALDTTPQDSIEIDPGLKTMPGSDSPTKRIPTIPKTPSL